MPICKGLAPGKDSQVFVLTTLENPPIPPIFFSDGTTYL